MQNLPEVIEMLATITRDFDYPLAMLTQELDILWFNDKAKEFFKRKKHFSTRLCDYAVGMKTDKAIMAIRSGTSCVYPAKNRVGKSIYVFETGYCERHLMLAAWVDDQNVKFEHERRRLESLVFQHHSNVAMQRLFAATERIEHSTLLDNDDLLLQDLYTIEREAYRMYHLIGDLRIMHKELDPFLIDSTRKFDFSKYFHNLITATTVTLAALSVNIKYTNLVGATRYVNANPGFFANSFLRLLKSVVMLMPSTPKNIRISMSEDEQGYLLVKIIAKNSELLNFLSDKHCNSGFSERSTNINNYGYALEYRTAEKIIKRNGMFLETTLEDDITTVCVKMKATDNPTGVLKSMDETYFGNKFSSIGFVFGDVM